MREENNRTRLHICVGCEGIENPTIIDFLGFELIRKFGGVSIFQGNGFWISDGNNYQDKYVGKCEKVSMINLILTIVPDREKEAIEYIENLLNKVKHDYSLNFSAVHIELSKVCTKHLLLP